MANKKSREISLTALFVTSHRLKSLATRTHRRAGGTDHIIGSIFEFDEDAIRSRIKCDTSIEGDEDSACVIAAKI